MVYESQIYWRPDLLDPFDGINCSSFNESSLLLQNLVSEIVLATSGVVNDPDNILSLLSSKYGVTIVQNKEDEPLGTGM